MDISTEKFVLVYSLQKAEGLDVLLPSAYICDLDKYGQPAYIRATALMQNIETYGLFCKNTVHQTLIELCNELSVTELEKVLNKNKKKFEKITSLFSDPKVQKTIHEMIDRRMVKFFEMIRLNQCFLCFNLQRKIKANDILLNFFLEKIQPHLLFRKTQTGIRYELKLKIGDKLVKPVEQNILIFANMPGIICIGNMIMHLSDINAAKLKPFLKNESVFIPNKLIRTYFEQFVVDVMGKVDVEAEGFTIHRLSSITGKSLFFVYDFIENKWMMDTRYEYHMFQFSGSDRSVRKTKITFDDHDDVIVYEGTRDKESENTIEKILRDLGFQKLYHHRYVYNDDKFSVLEKVSAEIETLSSVFTIENTEVDGKRLTFCSFSETTDFTLIHDWFDLNGTVRIANVDYPISWLFRNIKANDPYFKLADGTYALIPAAIMNKYDNLVRFGYESADKWRLSKTHFTLIESLHADWQNNKGYDDVAEINYISPPTLQAQLRPYQVEGVKWLINHRNNKMGACLADDMGLGKTLQTIAALIDAKESMPTAGNGVSPVQLDLFGEVQFTGRKSLGALIILPASLVFNWYNELKKYAPSLQVLNYSGNQRTKAEKTLLTFDIILTTYQTIISDINSFRSLHFYYIILDESQQIRNKKSKTFNAVLQLSADHRISLSGTPIENSLADLWSQMEFINPSILGTYPFFKENFQIPIEKYRDQKAIEDLKLILDPFILRRTKEQVAKDLPELIQNVYFAEMTEEQSDFYEKEKSAARNHLAGLDRQNGQFRFHVLSSLMKLRQIANHPVMVDQEFRAESGKFEDVKEHILTISKAGHKVLIFSSFLSHLDLFADWMTSEGIPYLMLTGSMSSAERESSVYQFQNDHNYNVFLLSIKAGGTGLNLTAADYVFILDPWWNPFVELQAVARAHRIGQKNNVMVVRFISKNTVEEKIMKLQEKKKTLSEDIIDVNDLNDFDDVDLEELMA